MSRKAVALISGGLDSLLATKLIQEQGIEVEGINFDQVARRLRTGYYHLWMENPQSITPNSKMPRYTQGNKSPLPDYDNDAQKQFDAILEYFRSLEKK